MKIIIGLRREGNTLLESAMDKIKIRELSKQFFSEIGMNKDIIMYYEGGGGY